MRKAKIGDVVLVRWVDSSRTVEWSYQAPTLKRSAHESVGYLSHRDKQAVNIRPHRMVDPDGDEQHFGDMTIPACSVLSIKVLR